MKIQTLIVSIFILIGFYTLLLLSVSGNLFSVASNNPVIYIDEDTGDEFICGNYLSHVGVGYYDKMAEYCEAQDFRCDTWKVYTTSYYYVSYINCADGYATVPIHSRDVYCPDGLSLYGVQTTEFIDAINYCNSIGPWECISGFTPSGGSWYARMICTDKPPNKVCYSCENNVVVNDMFVDTCPQGWHSDSNLDCREIVDCFQCSHDSLIVEQQRETCGIGWNPINETVANNPEYCLQENKVIKYFKDYWYLNTGFVIGLLLLLSIFSYKKER